MSTNDIESELTEILRINSPRAQLQELRGLFLRLLTPLLPGSDRNNLPTLLEAGRRLFPDGALLLTIAAAGNIRNMLTYEREFSPNEPQIQDAVDAFMAGIRVLAAHYNEHKSREDAARTLDLLTFTSTPFPSVAVAFDPLDSNVGHLVARGLRQHGMAVSTKAGRGALSSLLSISPRVVVTLVSSDTARSTWAEEAAVLVTTPAVKTSQSAVLVVRIGDCLLPAGLRSEYRINYTPSLSAVGNIAQHVQAICMRCTPKTKDGGAPRVDFMAYFRGFGGKESDGTVVPNLFCTSFTIQKGSGETVNVPMRFRTRRDYVLGLCVLNKEILAARYGGVLAYAEGEPVPIAFINRVLGDFIINLPLGLAAHFPTHDARAGFILEMLGQTADEIRLRAAMHGGLEGEGLGEHHVPIESGGDAFTFAFEDAIHAAAFALDQEAEGLAKQFSGARRRFGETYVEYCLASVVAQYQFDTASDARAFANAVHDTLLPRFGRNLSSEHVAHRFVGW